MGKATYVQAGKKLDYPNGTGKTINAGDDFTDAAADRSVWRGDLHQS